MKRTVLERLSRRYLLPVLPGFVAKRHLIVASPVGWLLRGFLYEESGHTGRDFYMRVFVQPLYIPVGYVILSYGERLGRPGSRIWSFDDGAEADVMADLRATWSGKGSRS